MNTQKTNTGMDVYTLISAELNTAAAEVAGHTPSITVAATGRSLSASWKLDHRLRLIRSIAYERLDSSGVITTTNKLVTSTGTLLGVSTSAPAAVGRFHSRNFADHAVMTLVGSSRDADVDGLLALAEMQPKTEYGKAAA